MSLGLQRGALFAGRYRVVRRLGSGAMGSVYEVVHLQTERLCALKIMHPHIVERAEMRERFRLEAKVAARVGSQYIVDVLDAGVDESSGIPYFVMERLRGEDLSRRLKRVGHLPPEEAVTYLHQVSIALDRMHQASIVHRDLKPANLFLTEGPDGQPRIKVLDFGVAKFITEASGGATTAIAGTPLYMSPEQCRGAKVTTAADVYAFGMIAYALLVGDAYFADEFAQTSNLVAFALATVKGPIEPATARAAARNVDLPGAFDEWFSIVTSVEPSRRFVSAGEAVRALANALGLPPLPQVSASMPPTAPTSVGPDSQELTQLAEDAGADWMAPTATATASPEASSDIAGRDSALGSQLSAAPHVTDTAQRTRRATTQPAHAGRRWLWIGAAALAATATDLLVSFHHRSDDERASAPPLIAANSVLACPLFEASGVAEPAGWLGAAAASTVCERARIILGATPSKTLVPAELLSLPAEPVDHFAKDPYGEPQARARTLEAARKRATAYVDGQVIKEREGFHITLTLRKADDTEIARTEGRGRALYEAVRQAMTPLVTGSHLPKAAALDPAYAEWSRARSVDGAIALLDVTLAIHHNAGTLADECADLQRRADDIAEMGPVERWRCAYTLGVVPAPTVFLSPDPSSSPGALAVHARFDEMTTGTLDSKQLPKLREYFDQEKSSLGRSTIATTLSCMLEASEPDQAVNYAHIAVRADPRNLIGEFCAPWKQLLSMTRDTASVESVIAARQAWLPWDPNAWLASAIGRGNPKDAIVYARRAYTLAPFDAYIVDTLADKLLSQGEREEVRNVALATSAGGYPVHSVESNLLFSRVEASIAHFGAALSRARQAMSVGATDAGWVQVQRFEIAWQALQVAEILGRGTEVADQIVERFLDPEPAPLDGNHLTAPLRIPAICLQASEPVAKRCLARFRSLRAQLSGGIMLATDAFTEGAERYARKDWSGAAKAWKPLLREPDLFARVLSDAMEETFERTGDEELVQRLESIGASAGADEYNGATMADVRAARRAAKHGDVVRAQLLARKVVDAWSVADESIPAVLEMRKLLTSFSGGSATSKRSK